MMKVETTMTTIPNNCYRDSYWIAKEIFQHLEISAHTPLIVEFSYAYEWKN